MALLWVAAGFAAFGALVGTTCGLSSAELTTTLLGLLFALIGGSIGVFLGKLDDSGRKVTGVALVAFSIFAMAGLFSGIYIRINDLLRITPLTAAAGEKAAKVDDYLKSNIAELEQSLKLDLYADRTSLAAACELMDEQRRVNAKP